MSARRAARAAKYKGSKKKAPSWKCNWCHMSETRNQRPGPDGPKTLCDKCYHRHRNGETGPRVADWKCDWCGADDAAPPPSGLQREQAQLEAEFESLSDAARTVEARTEDVSRLAAQFATLVDEQHDQVVTLDGLVGDTANQVDKAGDHVAQAASRRATLPRVFNAVVLSLAALLLLIHAVHS